MKLTTKEKNYFIGIIAMIIIVSVGGGKLITALKGNHSSNSSNTSDPCKYTQFWNDGHSDCESCNNDLAGVSRHEFFKTRYPNASEADFNCYSDGWQDEAMTIQAQNH